MRPHYASGRQYCSTAPAQGRHIRSPSRSINRSKFTPSPQRAHTTRSPLYPGNSLAGSGTRTHCFAEQVPRPAARDKPSSAARFSPAPDIARFARALELSSATTRSALVIVCTPAALPDPQTSRPSCPSRAASARACPRAPRSPHRSHPSRTDRSPQTLPGACGRGSARHSPARVCADHGCPAAAAPASPCAHPAPAPRTDAHAPARLHAAVLQFRRLARGHQIDATPRHEETSPISILTDGSSPTSRPARTPRLQCSRIQPTMADTEFTATQWWQTGVIYQIYPRSFQDTNGDGVGDLPGITARLDYLAGLGIDAIWISPFYPSPMADFGYDVADYTGVDPLFGTLADFDRLIAARAQQGPARHPRLRPQPHLRPASLVPRIAALRATIRSATGISGTIPCRSRPRRPPGSGRPQQLDVALRRPRLELGRAHRSSSTCTRSSSSSPTSTGAIPQVREAIYSAMRFWLDRGVDGFRMDVLWLLIKDDQFRDNPPNPDYHGDHARLRRHAARLHRRPARNPRDRRRDARPPGQLRRRTPARRHF